MIPKCYQNIRTATRHSFLNKKKGTTYIHFIITLLKFIYLFLSDIIMILVPEQFNTGKEQSSPASFVIIIGKSDHHLDPTIKCIFHTTHCRAVSRNAIINTEYKKFERGRRRTIINQQNTLPKKKTNKTKTSNAPQIDETHENPCATREKKNKKQQSSPRSS